MTGVPTVIQVIRFWDTQGHRHVVMCRLFCCMFTWCIWSSWRKSQPGMRRGTFLRRERVMTLYTPMMLVTMSWNTKQVNTKTVMDYKVLLWLGFNDINTLYMYTYRIAPLVPGKPTMFGNLQWGHGIVFLTREVEECIEDVEAVCVSTLDKLVRVHLSGLRPGERWCWC